MHTLTALPTPLRNDVATSNLESIALNLSHLPPPAGPGSRRRFMGGLGGLLAAGAAFRTGLWPTPALAQARRMPPAVLRGTEFDLEIAPLPVSYLGADRIATAINGSIPGPELRWREGDTVTLRVTNKLPVTSSIHWHGIRTATTR